MTGKITFTIIKPCAVSKDFTGQILSMINKAGFKIIALKLTKISKEQAELFYDIHKGKPFYESLVKFMCSAPLVAAILYKYNAIEEFRKLIGSTNPANADEGTIRKLFGEDVQQNAIHGSDSDENAIIDSNFFFSELERYCQK